MASGRARRFLRGLLGAPLAALGVGVVLAYIGVAGGAPWLAPYDPLVQDLSAALAPPSPAHPFGTDPLGRDLLSRVIAASRVDLTIAATGTGVASALAVPLGLASAYAGGAIDRAIAAALDSALTFPTLLLAVVLVNLVGNGLGTVIGAVAVTATPALFRVVRGAVLQIAVAGFVDSARAAGAGSLRIIWRHLLPNIVGQAAVYATLLASQAVLTVTALGFLGLGVQPPTPEWGAMLARSRTYLSAAPFVMLFPGLAIGGLVLGLNLLGDALQDALDPRGTLRRAAF
ncbi:MAG TPA: ABC transporter permease [bacterium]|nr:ABC transporter permease [bacterium]